jgi:uncharacterized membrane protein
MPWMLQIYQRIVSSLWFIPGLLVGGAVVAAVGLVMLDETLDFDLRQKWPRLFGAGTDGSRTMLSAIATSMLTVAGVVFSITIVTLTMASNQFSPRVLRNFMRSKVTQTVLGALMGIYAYCLVVLRSIHSADEGEFVPAVAVLAAVALALVGVGLLIFFIHHIATSIQVATVMDEVRRETLAAVDQLFPDELGHDPGDDEPPPFDSDQTSWKPVAAQHTGYLRRVDESELLKFARTHRTVIRVEPRIGSFIAAGTCLAAVSDATPIDDAAARELNRCFFIDRWRTMHQDASFGIQLLVDIALKALSPGINDSTTAIACVDHLNAILLYAVRRKVPSRFRYDEGELRVIAAGPTFEDLLKEACDPIRRVGDFATLERLVGAMEFLLRVTSNTGRREAIEQQLELLDEAAEQRVSSPHDRGILRLRIERARNWARPLATA